jgi:hypothetical protein
MRSWLLPGFAAGVVIACCSPVAATTTSLAGLKEVRTATSVIEDVVYTYRRTKHGFERCYHRNRFGSRSWRSWIFRIPDC